jgi:outer membrane protein TolC
MRVLSKIPSGSPFPAGHRIPAVFLTLIITLFLVPTSLWAAPLELSVDQAVELALGSSLDIFGQGQAVASALRNLENRWNLFLPGISAGATARWSDDLFLETSVRPGATAADPFSTSVSLGTSLSITTGVFFDLEDRRTGYHSAVLTEREARSKLVRDTEKAYFMLVSLELDLENKERAIALAGDRLRLASYRFETGLGSELELLRARLSEQTTRSTHEKAVADYRKRQAAFKRQLGLDASVPIRLTTSLEFPASSLELDLEGLIDGRADLGKARLGLATTALAIERFKAAYRLPVLKFDASYNFSVADFETASDRVVLAASLSFNADSWIPNSRRNLELRSLRESQERLGLKYEQDRRNALDTVNALLLDLELAGKGLLLSDAQVQLAERIYEGTQAAYERGMAIASQLESDGAAVANARQSLIASRYQYLALLIDLGYELDTDWRTLFR